MMIVMKETVYIPPFGLLEKDNEYDVPRDLCDQLVYQGLAHEAMPSTDLLTDDD